MNFPAAKAAHLAGFCWSLDVPIVNTRPVGTSTSSVKNIVRTTFLLPCCSSSISVPTCTILALESTVKTCYMKLYIVSADPFFPTNFY